MPIGGTAQTIKKIMKTKITTLTIFCGWTLWVAAQTSGNPPNPGPDDNHGFATPGGGGFVTPGHGFVTPGTGDHGFAAPGQTNGFVKPGTGDHGFASPGQTNG